MNILNLIVSEAADNDIREIYDFILKNSGFEERALKIVDDIYYSAELLAEFPLIGRAYDYIYEGVRIFPMRKTASIIYMASETEIQILRVFYAGRDF